MNSVLVGLGMIGGSLMASNGAGDPMIKTLDMNNKLIRRLLVKAKQERSFEGDEPCELIDNYGGGSLDVIEALDMTSRGDAQYEKSRAAFVKMWKHYLFICRGDPQPDFDPSDLA